eukprot:513182_1
MAESSYYTEQNRKVEYLTDPFQINETTFRVKLAASPHEMEYHNWLQRNPNDQNAKLMSNKQSIIKTWKDYASHMSSCAEGTIWYHFARLVLFDNEKISCDTKCIHNDFMSVQNCITNLFLALSGSIMMFRKFESARLCYDCLMYLCSDTRKIEKLFN